MKTNFVTATLLIVLSASGAGLQTAADPHSHQPSKSHAGPNPNSAQTPYQRQETWYEFMLKQLNRDNTDYGNWIEERRREFIDARIRNPYFLYSVGITVGLLLVTTVCVKLHIDHRRFMWITAEVMADIYNQDTYSRQIAQEAIERYNHHIEQCNRAIEAGENGITTSTTTNEVEQLRTDLMRVAEERDAATRERDIAREQVRKKSEILADISVRLETLKNKTGATSATKVTAEMRGADPKLVSVINTLQEQLYVERNNNRRLRGG